MSNQFSLLKTKRFLPMFITQYLGAFNDNLFKQFIILLITATVITSTLSTYTNLAAILFILPYFIFSATAGQLADKYEKSKLAQYLKLAEIAIMLLATLGFFLHLLPLLMVCLFLMGTHSTFFGPIKYAILPQLLDRDELVGGNALFEMGTSLAILMGMMTAGIIISQSNHDPIWMSAAVLLVAICGYAASRFIPIRQINQAAITIDWNFFRTTKQTVSFAYKHREVYYAILGISWFWYYGATYLTQVPQFTKQVLNGSDEVVTLLITIFSIGISIGALMCERLTNHKINLKLVAIGAIGASAFGIELYFALHHYAPTITQQTIKSILHNPANYRMMFDLLAIGAFSGVYLVQLYAFLQAKSPESHRARIIAANNIFNALFMVISSVVTMLCLDALHLSLAQLFLITALLGVIVSVYITSKLKHMRVDP